MDAKLKALYEQLCSDPELLEWIDEAIEILVKRRSLSEFPLSESSRAFYQRMIDEDKKNHNIPTEQEIRAMMRRCWIMQSDAPVPIDELLEEHLKEIYGE